MLIAASQGGAEDCPHPGWKRGLLCLESCVKKEEEEQLVSLQSLSVGHVTLDGNIFASVAAAWLPMMRQEEQRKQ
ncbi:UNVERIFIED_CONTAM: hypothetical protein K2H54_048772 [Gekko kuhli]